MAGCGILLRNLHDPHASEGLNGVNSTRRSSASLVAYPLPAIWRTEGAEQGGLIGYGPRNDAVFRQCALQVAKLLRGATVADVPVEQPTKIELGSNAKTARALSIAIPLSILARADQVIE